MPADCSSMLCTRKSSNHRYKLQLHENIIVSSFSPKDGKKKRNSDGRNYLEDGAWRMDVGERLNAKMDTFVYRLSHWQCMPE